MKYLLLLIFPIFSFAQDKFKVEYERVKFMEFGNDHDNSSQEYSKPKYFEVVGNNNECLGKEIIRINNSQNSNGELNYVGGFKDLESYYNFEKDYLKVSREMESKLYLIKLNIPKSSWNLTKETKIIKGFNAKKATYEEGDLLVEAWYSTEIKSKCGPEFYNNLPGLILEVKRSSKSDSKFYATYKLVSIQLDSSIQFKEPTKGKVINENEFLTLEKDYRRRVNELVEAENSKNGVDKD